MFRFFSLFQIYSAETHNYHIGPPIIRRMIQYNDTADLATVLPPGYLKYFCICYHKCFPSRWTKYLYSWHSKYLLTCSWYSSYLADTSSSYLAGMASINVGSFILCVLWTVYGLAVALFRTYTSPDICVLPLWHCTYLVLHPLRSSDAIWRHSSRSTLISIMASCFAVPGIMWSQIVPRSQIEASHKSCRHTYTWKLCIKLTDTRAQQTTTLVIRTFYNYNCLFSVCGNIQERKPTL